MRKGKTFGFSIADHRLVSYPRENFLIVLATCLIGAPALLLSGGMPARTPAQHAESVRHVAFQPDISESIVNSSPEQSTSVYRGSQLRSI